MHFYWTNQNLASWVTEDYLEQQRLRLPDHIFRRLHCNEWTTGSGTFLTRGDVAAATDPGLSRKFEGETGLSYHMALDLGLRRDRTALVICHKNQGGVILDYLKLWQARQGGELRIEDIEEHILDLAGRFNLRKIVFDPWQSIRTRQRLQRHGLPVEEFTFSASNVAKLTSNLLSLFKDRQIKIFDHPELTKELLSAKIVERSYGYRIDHESGSHDDTVIALGMAALDLAKGAPGLWTGCDLT